MQTKGKDLVEMIKKLYFYRCYFVCWKIPHIAFIEMLINNSFNPNLMIQRNSFYYVLACLLFMGITACNKDNQIEPEEDIPSTIRDDFSTRYPDAEIIKTYPGYLTFCQIDFIDEEQNQASALYRNGTWEKTCTYFKQVVQLPEKVQQAFVQAGYSSGQLIEKAYKTEQAGIEKALYTIHFLYPRKTTKDVTHNVLIDDDGMLLQTLTESLYDPIKMSVPLSESHLGFIAGRYTGAKVKAYVHVGGRYEYIILHEGIFKYVYFESVDMTKNYFWFETRYELSQDARIPANVWKVLKDGHPDFTYTNIYYIESRDGNSYLFVDKNHEHELGYSIYETLGL